MSNLTGKQKRFLTEYLQTFNATAAAKAAGYRANSKHGFEAIGSENLTRPAIAAAVSEHFRTANMAAEEVLTELAKLAHGTSKDKVKALELLGKHHGLFDGTYREQFINRELEIRVVYEKQKVRDELINEMQADVDQFNKEVTESNAKKTQFMREVQKLFTHNPEAVFALQLMYDVALERTTIAEAREEVQKQKQRAEPVPPERRLEPAPIEKMMAQVEVVEGVVYSGSASPREVSKPDPKRLPTCRHGNLPGMCAVIDIGKPECPHWYKRERNGNESGVAFFG